MKTEERVKLFVEELQSGEKFIFHEEKDELVVGFRMELDSKFDEIVILRAENPKQLKYKVVKKK